jgi:hypothetical protein
MQTRETQRLKMQRKFSSIEHRKKKPYIYLVRLPEENDIGNGKRGGERTCLKR